jgi:hypothetical protein
MEETPSLLLRADAALRLGPSPVALHAWHRLRLALGLPQRALAEAPPPAVGAFLALPATAPPPPPILPEAHCRAVLDAALALRGAPPPDWHGPFDPTAPALDLDLFHPGDVRPVWEASRLAALPLLAQAHRLDPTVGHAAAAEALLADWTARNPAFRGPNWACAQEASLRVLHVALALALLGATPGPALRQLLGLHLRRIEATTAYAAAQDNNHPVSEAAGILVSGLLLGDACAARRGSARLSAVVARLVAPDGGFAQVSAGYLRLLLDTLALAEWLRRRHGAPGFAAPFAERAAAATLLLARLTDPATGASARLGPEDDSVLADLSLAGPRDARPSLERAARVFGCAAGMSGFDPGCAWLGLATLTPPFERPEASWCAGGLVGFAGEGGAWAVLRCGGPLRFRPGQSDLLHLDLWDRAQNLLRDGGTLAYNPPADQRAVAELLAGAAGHNTILFDDAEPMPRASRFLFARWPRMGLLTDGAWLRDWRGNRHERRVSVRGRCWVVEDRLSGAFARATLRWRLAPGPWRATPDGVEGEAARITVTADAPVSLRLEQGWESPRYGAARRVPVLVAEVAAPVMRISTTIVLACERAFPSRAHPAGSDECVRPASLQGA